MQALKIHQADWFRLVKFGDLALLVNSFLSSPAPARHRETRWPSRLRGATKGQASLLASEKRVPVVE